jgi:hypothetical protein
MKIEPIVSSLASYSSRSHTQTASKNLFSIHKNGDIHKKLQFQSFHENNTFSKFCGVGGESYKGFTKELRR